MILIILESILARMDSVVCVDSTEKTNLKIDSDAIIVCDQFE